MGMPRKSRLTNDTGDPLHNLIKQHTNLQHTTELYTTQQLGGGLQGCLQVDYQSFSQSECVSQLVSKCVGEWADDCALGWRSE